MANTEFQTNKTKNPFNDLNGPEWSEKSSKSLAVLSLIDKCPK